MSRDGFYCYLPDPLTPGERIQCDIVVPTHAPRGKEDALFLRCCVQVVRVEQVEEGNEYGLACRTEDFAIVHRSLNGAIEGHS